MDVAKSILVDRRCCGLVIAVVAVICSLSSVSGGHAGDDQSLPPSIESPKFKLQETDRPDIAAILLHSHRYLFNDVQFEDAVRIRDGKLQLYETDGPFGSLVSSGQGEDEDSEQFADKLRMFALRSDKSGSADKVSARSFFRVADKVFSRVALPELYGQGLRPSETCDEELGCVEEMKNLPGFLKKHEFSSTFILHTPTGPLAGTKIKFKRTKHYQLQEKTHRQVSEPASTEQPAADQRESLGPTPTGNRHALRQTASSWFANSQIIDSKIYLFDLSLLERSGFNPNLNTRIVIGGYMTGDEVDWIDEMVELWKKLEPESNIIQMSWSQANHGLYAVAAYDARFAGRQLSILLHYLEEMYKIDYNKVHIVGHSLGAHIAGFVGHDKKGAIGRITGLDPAGPRFNDVNVTERVGADCAQFVDIIHSNGGDLTSVSFGLLEPVGHIDYYPNGGTRQPGCDPVNLNTVVTKAAEAIPCSHGRAHEFFREVLREYLKKRDTGEGIIRRAFRFEATLEQLRQGNVDLGDTLERQDDPFAVREIEFHSMHVDPPSTDKKMLYYFGTRGSTPYLDTRLYVLKMRSESRMNGEINVRLNLVDVIKGARLNSEPGVHSLPFAPDDLSCVRPDKNISSYQTGAGLNLELQWFKGKVLGFGKTKQIVLKDLELVALEPEDGEQRVIKLKSVDDSEFITRYKWHQFSS